MKAKIIAGVLVVVIATALVLCFILTPREEPAVLIIDSFEGPLIGGTKATVDYGSGAGAKVNIGPAKKPVVHGRQSLKIVYDVSQGGYMWVARGYGLTQKNAAQWKVPPEKIKWDNYDAFVFYLYGEANGNDVAVDLIDSGKEYWRFLIKDDTKGWKEVVIPFSDFSAREDWQPDSADWNSKMDFPIMAFQFEPKTGMGILFVDKVYLRKKEVTDK